MTTKTTGAGGADGDPNELDGDLSDMLQETRILQNGAQTLTAFLIILPFGEGFTKIQQAEKWVFVFTFACAVSSLVLFNAPAAQHRLERPLGDRERFKRSATRLIVSGLALLSVALVLATHMVISEVLGWAVGTALSVAVALLIGVIWWWLPVSRKRSQAPREQREKGRG